MVKRMARELASGSDGDIYDGEWKDDKQHGKGTFKWPHGDMYEGEWKDHYMLDKAETDEFGSCGVACFAWLRATRPAARPSAQMNF